MNEPDALSRHIQDYLTDLCPDALPVQVNVSNLRIDGDNVTMRLASEYGSDYLSWRNGAFFADGRMTKAFEDAVFNAASQAAMDEDDMI